MTFYSSSDSEQCPLLLQDDNLERYYDSFSEVPQEPPKHNAQKAATASSVEEETTKIWERLNSPSQTAQSSESLEGNGGEVSESLDTTLSSTPNNEEEISYYSLPGIVAPGEEVERRHEVSRITWAGLGRPYKSFLRYSKSKLSKTRQGVREWILVAFVGCLAALMAFIIDNSQAILFDVKYGFCSDTWYFNKRKCCSGFGDCNAWHKWSSLSPSRPAASTGLDILIYISLVLTLSTTACALTLLSRTKQSLQNTLTPSPTPSKTSNPPSIPAAGSGVREIKLVINNFQFPGYLTSKTVLLKATAMILSTSSALSIGKEGPFVHLGAGVSAWVARVFDVKPGETRRLLLCAGVASGLAVAFGAPVSGVVFVLEEFSMMWTPKQLMLILFCTIISSLSLKLLEPFGNRMPVLIDVHYTTDWSLLELPAFLFLGALGGILGALFIKACRFWAKTYRRIAVIKRYPMLDILLIALLTGVSSYWNQYTKLGDSELLSNLAATCNRGVKSSPHLGSFKSSETLSTLLIPLVVAFIVKGILTIVSFGLCVPAGIYVPSMAIGALLGKAIGHSVEALSKNLPLLACPTEKGVSCVNPEVYALIGAGAMMCGVTRLPVTLTIILFELTGSLKYVGCFCIAILVAKWVADCIEEGNIYDLVSSLHAYPISSITSPTSTKTLSSILPSQSPSNTSIDITHSPLIPSSLLQQRLTTLLSHDPSGGIIITSHSKPINLLPVEALKTALASLKNNSSSTACLLSAKRWEYPEQGIRLYAPERDSASYYLWRGEEVDFTGYLVPPPITLEINSPIQFAADCFQKLGLEYVCAVENGKYVGLVRKQDLYQDGAFHS